MNNDKCKLYDAIREAKKEILRINAEEWKLMYEKRCGKSFIEFEEFIDQIAFCNLNISGENNREAIESFKEDLKYSVTDVWIPNVIRKMESCNMKQLFLPQQDMICAACACKGCPSIKEHLGYDCKECKNKMHHSGYEGYCDE